MFCVWGTFIVLIGENIDGARCSEHFFSLVKFFCYIVHNYYYIFMLLFHCGHNLCLQSVQYAILQSNLRNYS